MATPAEELALLGNVKETVKVLGRTFVIKTLDSDEESAARSASSIFDQDTKTHVLKMEKLARAIETIDGVGFPVTPEEQSKSITSLQKARVAVFKWHPPVVRRVYDELDRLEKRREQVIADLEKNGSAPTTGSTAGK